MEGLLYVTSIAESDLCFALSKQYVPHNVTRQSNLPHADYCLVAVAPFIGAACAKSYFCSARLNGARGLLTNLTHD